MKKLSFRIKIVIAVCLINLVVISILTFLNYTWYSNLLISQTRDQTQELVQQVGSNINTYIDELYRLTLTPYYNDSVMNSLETAAETRSESLAAKRMVENFLSSVMSLPRDEILRVYVMNEVGIYAYTRTPYEMADYANYLESDWYQEAQLTTAPIFIQPQLERVYGDNRTPVFSLVRILRSKNDNSKLLGVVKVDADFTGIRKICDHTDLDYDGILLVANNQNEILYQSSNDEAKVRSIPTEELQSIIATENSDQYLINRYDLPKCGISIIALHSYKAMILPLRAHLMKSLGVSASCTIIAAILFAFVIRAFLKPLFQIIKLMKAVGTGNLNVAAEVETHDEIGFLAESFNNMTQELGQTLERNTQLTKEIYEAQYLAKEAQYNALCSQIKPHFLYNTLNTISLLIKCNSGEKAVKAIECFSTYLGGIMNADREISLYQELQICKAYLNIVELRYQDRLTYVIDIDDSLYGQSIPALTIQPIVENAVKYACESQRKSTRITVCGKISSSTYEIIVTDNGPGIASCVLEKIYENMKNVRSDEEGKDRALLGNIGLVNIWRRLHLKFGDSARFHIESSEGGTSVYLELPLYSGEGEEYVSNHDCG